MSAEEGTLPAELVIETASLYAQSGFERGNLLKGSFPHLGAADLRELLADVVQQHVIPRLDQRVQTLRIPTVHNPIRATSVDGVAVNWTPEKGNGPQLTPATVCVMAADILSCARKRRVVLVPEIV